MGRPNWSNIAKYTILQVFHPIDLLLLKLLFTVHDPADHDISATRTVVESVRLCQWCCAEETSSRRSAHSRLNRFHSGNWRTFPPGLPTRKKREEEGKKKKSSLAFNASDA